MDSHLGYPDGANPNQVTSLGNGHGKVSGMGYLGYPGHSSGSNNYNPVATGGREKRAAVATMWVPDQDDSSISTNHPHKAKSPRGVYQSPTSRSYIGGFGSDGPTRAKLHNNDGQ